MNTCIPQIDLMKKSYLQQKNFSKLQVKHTSENDYKHAKKVWDVFKIKTLGEYHDLYVQADTAQLSDVFESFRLLCLKEYQLDPAYTLELC